jgi:hypothetical protein
MSDIMAGYKEEAEYVGTGLQDAVEGMEGDAGPGG